ncbi:MAG: GDSL-type esterase/lipase family protein [Bacteroidales bacterium]
MYRIIALVLLLFVYFIGYSNRPTRIACVGNSITEGLKLNNPKTDAYPAQLQAMLGNKYIVGNFGKSGATLLSRGHKPYIKQMEYLSALSFMPDIVIIHLGINDTDPRNWSKYGEDFVNDYLALINAFREENPNVKVFIARISPIRATYLHFQSGTRQWHQEIQRTIEFVAIKANVRLIDFHSPLYHYPMLLPDAIHPNKEGAKLLAKTVYSAITGNYGGLQMSPMYSDKMMLPQGKAFDIRGKANAREIVRVQIGNQTHTSTTDLNGNWGVTILPLKAGSTYTLTITIPHQQLQYTDILAGDIWLCSGQSNMAWRVNQTEIEPTDSIHLSDSTIRLFNMKGRWTTQATDWNTTVYDSLNQLLYFTQPHWQYADSANCSQFSAIAYYFARKLRNSQNIPIGLICNAVEGAPIEAWIERSTLERTLPDIFLNWYENEYVQDWVRNNANKKINQTIRHPFEPTYLFEAGVYRLDKFPIKGVLWYQGESNAHNIELHEKLFGMFINSWRDYFEQNKLPFYYVQLSSISTRPTWANFRNSQRRLMAEYPYTYMIVSSDVGDSTNINPSRKKPVGERLAQAALRYEYGHKQIIPLGPLYKSVRFDDGAAYVSFSHSKGLRSADNSELKSFEIAEYPNRFFPAKAQIINQQVRVYNEIVKMPRYVRYGWKPFTNGNLVNEAGLPASTFRTK